MVFWGVPAMALIALLGMVYLNLHNACESVGREIKRLESQRTELRKQVVNEERNWEMARYIRNMQGLMDALPIDSDLRPKWEAIIAATEAGMALNIGALEEGAEDFAGVIQVQLIQRMVEQIETANEQWGDAFSGSEAFGSLAHDWILHFDYEVFQPILSSLESSMEEMGIEKSSTKGLKF
mgnify:CR=1 FL=1